jgi:hypothetical protein
MKNTSTCLTLAVLSLCLANRVWAVGMEDVGNAALSEPHYRDWQGVMPLVNHPSRVYHSWVNGDEQFYYRGDTKALNDALQKFAAVNTEVHEVLLQPGPGITHSFDTQTIPYNWNLHIIGGVSRHLTTLDQGEKIWSKSPTMTVCVGGDIALEKTEIPTGVSVVDLSDLSRRYREALTSTDKTVRGWGAGHLARLDPYNTDNLGAIATLLKDEDEWVRRNVVGAVAVFGKKAESVLPVLRGMLSTQDKQLKDRVEKTIQKIQQAEDTTAAEQEHRLIQERIRKFCDSWRSTNVRQLQETKKPTQ